MIAILHNIRSKHNVGSIFRTADAASVEKIYLCGYTPEPLPKVSLGAEKWIPFEKVKSATALIDRLKKSGFKIYAIEQSKKSIPYHRVNLLKLNLNRLGLIFGNEVRGLSLAVLKRADKILEIPMRGRKESLNVAVALGITIFHFIMLDNAQEKK